MTDLDAVLDDARNEWLPASPVLVRQLKAVSDETGQPLHELVDELLRAGLASIAGSTGT